MVKNNQRKNVEKIIEREKKKLLVSGALLVVLGLVDVVLSILEGQDSGFAKPGWFQWVVGSLWLLVLITVYSRDVVTKLIRSSQDEYEKHMSNEAKARAFNFLNFGVFFVVFLSESGGRFAIGILTLILGMSWLLVARGGAHLDV